LIVAFSPHVMFVLS